MSLSDRLDLTRPDRKQSKKLPTEQQQEHQRHCIWVQVGKLEIPENKRQMWSKILADAFSKVFSAFRNVNIFLTTDNPDACEWGEDYTQVFVVTENKSVDYLGIAIFRLGQVTKMAAARIDSICSASYVADLSLNQLSNLIANTIAHEIAHTLGLDHSDLHTDLMHDGLDHRVHSLMPPSFYAEQIILMNHAIAKHKSA